MKKTPMWFLERLRAAGENGEGAERARGPGYSNVLTPDKIPDFFIPPKLPAAPAEPEPAPAPAPAPAPPAEPAPPTEPRAPRSPRLPARLAAESRSLLRAATRHVIQVESAEDCAEEEAAPPAESPRRGDSDTGSSAESSPFGSPLLSRSVSLLRGFALDGQAKVSQLSQAVARPGSLSADDSSPHSSPGARRRRPRAPRAPAPAPGPPAPPAPGERAVSLGPRGCVRLRADYQAAQARLRVRLLAAEGLYDRRWDARAIHCCVALCLVPGKLQKQRSTAVKHSRRPEFNEDFFFDGLGPASVGKLALRIKVVNKGGSLKRDTLLGEEELPLSTLLPCACP